MDVREADHLAEIMAAVNPSCEVSVIEPEPGLCQVVVQPEEGSPILFTYGWEIVIFELREQEKREAAVLSAIADLIQSAQAPPNRAVRRGLHMPGGQA